MKHFIKGILAAIALFYSDAYGQTMQPAFVPAVTLYITIPDSSIITGVSPSGTPTFNNSGINSIISQYNVTEFHRAFPHARRFFLRQVYSLKGTVSRVLG